MAVHDVGPATTRVIVPLNDVWPLVNVSEELEGPLASVVPAELYVPLHGPVPRIGLVHVMLRVGKAVASRVPVAVNGTGTQLVVPVNPAVTAYELAAPAGLAATQVMRNAVRVNAGMNRTRPQRPLR
jgi:hypothetical protein